MRELSVTEASDRLSKLLLMLARTRRQRKLLQQASADYFNAVNKAASQQAYSAMVVVAQVIAAEELANLERRVTELEQRLEQQ